MIVIEESVRIARPAADVWAAVSDFGFDLRWRAELVETSCDPPGPPADGTRLHEVIGDYVADTVLEDVRPGSSFRFSGSGTAGRLAGGRAVRPDGAGAVFTYTIELEAAEIEDEVRASLREDLERLRSILERDLHGTAQQVAPPV